MPGGGYFGGKYFGAYSLVGNIQEAGVSPVTGAFSILAVTATYVLVLTASVPTASAAFSVPPVTATYVLVETATVPAVSGAYSLPAVAATYHEIDSAVVPTVSGAFSAPAVAATYLEVDSAVVPAVSGAFSLPSVSPTYVYINLAGDTPLRGRFSIPRVKATFDGLGVIEEQADTIPVATKLFNPKYIFVIESMDGTFKYATENWEFDEITREINGSMMVVIRTDTLTTEIANAITDLTNRVTIRIATPATGPAGIVYFTGYIPTRALHLQPENQSIEITAFGFASRLFDIPYRDGTTIKIDQTGGIKASDLAKDVIDKVRAIDSNFPANYAAGSVEDSGDTVKDKFVLQGAGDVINKAALLAFDTARIWHWTLLGDNVFRFKKNSTTADHNLVYGRDVLVFPAFAEDLQQSKNEVLVVYNGGANVKLVSDTDNIALYGLRSLVVNEQNIVDEPTAEELGNAYLASLVAPVRSVIITVGSDYPGGIENINPGDTCRIDNLPPDIAALLTKNMFVTKTTYKVDTVELELSLKHPFIQNQIDQIRRKVEKESVESIAATDYA